MVPGLNFDPRDREQLISILAYLCAGHVTIATSKIQDEIPTLASQQELLRRINSLACLPPEVLANVAARLGIARSKYELAPTQGENGDRLIKRMYHFTDNRNLNSIRTGGLLSHRALELEGVGYISSSSESSRRVEWRRNRDRFIRLCLRAEHPMADAAVYYRRVSNLTWIAVNPNILWIREALYADTNAISNSANIDDNPRTAIEGDDQAEVLVADSIPPEYLQILN